MTTAYDIFNSARIRAGLEFDDGLLDADGSVIPLFNAAMDEMAVDHDWSFNYTEDTFQTSPGQTLYNTPVDWLRTAWVVKESTGEQLTYKNRRTTMVHTTRGEPVFYDVVGDQLALAPAPENVTRYVHAYFAKFPSLVRDSDTYADVFDQLAAEQVNIPSPFVTLASLFLTKNIALRLKDRELYQMVNEEIRDFKRRIDDNRRRATAPGRIQTRSDTGI